MRLAMAALREKVHVQAISSVWRSTPIGGSGPDYLNAAALFSTPLDAGELKGSILRVIEEELGRVRGPDKHSPRTIDLDILLFDGQILDTDLFEYAHLAVPVAEIFPALKQAASGESVTVIARRLGRKNLLRQTKLRLSD